MLSRAVLQKRTVLSQLAVARDWPSGLNATALTAQSCVMREQATVADLAVRYEVHPKLSSCWV
jgi:hypothetical protein